MPLHSPFGQQLDIKRYPNTQNNLQAWNAADELALHEVHEWLQARTQPTRVLILHDTYGALTCGLIDLEPLTYTDSYTSARAIDLNSAQRAQMIHDLDELEGHYDLVVMQLPKSLAFLEDMLTRVAPHTNASTRLVAAGMVKHMAKGAFDLINRHVGETSTSLAKKKARLIFAHFTQPHLPSPFPIEVDFPGFERPMIQLANLFSAKKVDIGTRLLLEHIPRVPEAKTILDLGCGNGIIGVAMGRANPQAQIIFADDSHQATRSALINATRAEIEPAQVVWTNCYEDGQADTLDVVVCNPPFHHNHTVGGFIAHQMFRDAHRALKPGGLLRVIGNHRMGYPTHLGRQFKRTNIVSKNSKFCVVDAIK